MIRLIRKIFYNSLILLLTALLMSSNALSAPPKSHDFLVGEWESDQDELGERVKTKLTIKSSTPTQVTYRVDYILVKYGQTWSWIGRMSYSRLDGLLRVIKNNTLSSSGGYRGFPKQYFVNQLDRSTIHLTIPGGRGEIVRRYKRTSAEPDWMDYKYDPNDPEQRSVALPPLGSQSLRRNFCDSTILNNVSSATIEPREGSFTLKAQDAGAIFCSNPEFSIHETANYLHTRLKYKGPPRCIKNKNGKYWSDLVAILKKPRDYKITRRWMWDNLRPAVSDEVLPRVCPNASAATVRIFVEGYDVLSNGTPYQTSKVELPIIEKPSLLDQRTSFDGDFIGANQEYDKIVRQFISIGIVRAIFKGPAYKQRICERHELNCSYDTFSPEYFSDPDHSALGLLRNKLNTSSNPNNTLAAIDKREQLMDAVTDFNRLVRWTSRRHKHDEMVRKKNQEYEKRFAALRGLRDYLDDSFKPENFWKRFAAGLANGGVLDLVQCQNAEIEGRTIPWYCHKFFPSRFPQ